MRSYKANIKIMDYSS